MTKDTPQRQTCDVEFAGKRLGLGRNAAYEAAHRGDIPTIKIGRRLLVPIAALDRMLSGKAISWCPYAAR